MNVSQEQIDELNSVITIQLTKEDYLGTVEKKLKEQSRKAKLPGFRPGMVPVAHIKKLYGKSILVDEVNNILSSTLNKYIEDNQLQILGQPLPSGENDEALKWDFEDEFKFRYELGLAPQFKLSLSKQDRVIEYEIYPDNDTLESRIKNLRRAYGKMSSPEVAEKDDILYAEFVQVDSKDSPVSNGIISTGSLRLETVSDETQKDMLTGLKKDDNRLIDLNAVFSGNTRLIGALIKVSDDAVLLDNLRFRMTVKNVNRLGEAELGEEFYDKVFPEDDLKSEADFRQRVDHEIRSMTQLNAREKLDRDLVNYLVDKFDAKLPDDFLKRWLLAANENQYTPEEIENQYQEFQRNLKWTLVENKILKDNGIDIGTQEMIELAKEKLLAQIPKESLAHTVPEQLNDYALKLIQDREQSAKLYQELRARKTLNHVRTVISLDREEIAFNEFLKLR